MKVTRDTESQYLHEGKELMQLVQKQQSEIEQGELFPAGVDNDVSRLRTDLLKYGNELAACNERIYQLDFNLDGLREEKRLLEKEFEKLPKKEEIDKKVKDYSQEIEELKLDIAQRLHECKTLKDERTSRQEQTGTIKNELEELEREEQQLKVCLFIFIRKFCINKFKSALFDKTAAHIVLSLFFDKKMQNQ